MLSSAAVDPTRGLLVASQRLVPHVATAVSLPSPSSSLEEEEELDDELSPLSECSENVGRASSEVLHVVVSGVRMGVRSTAADPTAEPAATPLLVAPRGDGLAGTLQPVCSFSLLGISCPTVIVNG